MRFWTPEKVGILKNQWKVGASARVIAALLGSGRNAVIGKANRLGLPPHASARRPLDAAEKRALKKRAAKPGPARGRQGRRRSTPQGAPVPPPPPPPPPPASVEARGICFAGLAPDHCLYPVTEEPPFLFCGQIRREKSAYCLLHHALCYVKTRYGEARPRASRFSRSRFDFRMRGRA